MAEEALTYPIPQFRFDVEIDDIGEISFQEVTGLDTEIQSIDYRSGDSPNDSVLKIPGLKVYSNISFKRGIYPDDNKLYEWLQDVKDNYNGPEHEDQKKNIVISLRSDQDEVIMTWTVTNAFPVKLTGTTLNAQNNELAIETLEVTHEGLVQELP